MFAVTLLATFLLFASCEQPVGGGEDTFVKKIANAQDMAKIGVDEDWPLAGKYELANNITLENWMGIAGGAGEIFSGVFDGGGNTITLNGLALSGGAVTGGAVTGSTVTGSTVTLLGVNVLAGIFPRIEGNAEVPAVVKNLTVVVNAFMDEDPQSHMSVGVVAGYAKEADFENITIKGNISARNAYSGTGNRRLIIGGIAGIADGSTITGCGNEAEIYGFGTAGNAVYNQIGGIVGMFQGGTAITNCRNMGNVTGETSGQRTNVFAGGIAGGSYYAASADYRGKIEDCSSSGNIRAEGGSYWSWAGGIAATIVGGGSGDTGPTRIVRCRASGIISVNEAAGSWPYVGGITANNYYGAYVEQCYFAGDALVEGEGVNDYAGGIAGYNSQHSSANSTIQNCWSSGTVTGFLNAGGIVGQNQVNAVLRRCYSTAEIVVTAAAEARASQANQGAGGIAGFTVSTETDGLANCVALNTSVSAPNGFAVLGRVVGTNSASYVAGGLSAEDGNMRNNYAGSDMGVTIAGEPKEVTADINGIDGADCQEQPDRTFYEGLGWDFTTVWKMDADYPQLRWQ